MTDIEERARQAFMTNYYDMQVNAVRVAATDLAEAEFAVLEKQAAFEGRMAMLQMLERHPDFQQDLAAEYKVNAARFVHERIAYRTSDCTRTATGAPANPLAEWADPNN